MIWPAIAIASSTSARKIQSWNAIWCAASGASPSRVDDGAGEDERGIRRDVRRKMNFPSESSRRASTGRRPALPRPTRRRIATTNASAHPVCAITVPHAEPAIPQSKP